MAQGIFRKMPLGVLLLFAFSAFGSAQITTNTTLSADFLAKGVIGRMQSSGGEATLVAGSAEIVGISQATIDKVMVGLYKGLTELLVPDGAEGVIVPSGPASNLATGRRDRFPNDFSSPANPVEPLFTLVRDSGWLNGAGLRFLVEIPAGTISLSYAFCTSRLSTQYSNFDTVSITVAGVLGNTTLARTNIAVTNETVNNFMTVEDRFGQGIPEGQPGSDFGLSTNISRCLPAQVASIELFESGVYEIQLSASTQNAAPATNWPQAYLLVAGDFTPPNYPDNYDPAGAKFTSIDTFESVDTWCVIGTGTSNNFNPGYRVESTIQGPNEKLCCRLKGRYNSGANTCDMKNCVGPPTPVASFFLSNGLFDETDCYADCYFRSAFIGNDPFVDLAPNLQDVYDGRFETLSLLTAVLTPASFTFGEPFKRGLVIIEQDESLTGTIVTAEGVNYICTKAGFRFDASQALIGCDAISTGFICLSSAPDSRCYANCYWRV